MSCNTFKSGKIYGNPCLESNTYNNQSHLDAADALIPSINIATINGNVYAQTPRNRTSDITWNYV